jgi:hypothetical protein
MYNMKQRHHMHQTSQSENVEQGRLPYWKRAHHDWRFWLALVLMITAMAIYVMSEDLSMRPRSRPQQPVPGVIGK